MIRQTNKLIKKLVLLSYKNFKLMLQSDVRVKNQKTDKKCAQSTFNVYVLLLFYTLCQMW